MDDLETNRQAWAETLHGHGARKWMKRSHHHRHHHHRHHPKLPFEMMKQQQMTFNQERMFCPKSKRHGHHGPHPWHHGPHGGPHHHHGHHKLHKGCGPRGIDQEAYWKYFQMMMGQEFVKKTPRGEKTARDDRLGDIRKRMAWLNLASPPPCIKEKEAAPETEPEAGPSKE